jgi:hypothetical protein
MRAARRLSGPRGEQAFFRAIPLYKLHRRSFSGITLSATKGHTLFLNTPWTEHDCSEPWFRRNSSFINIPYESQQSKGCISKNEARRPTAARSRCGKPKKGMGGVADKRPIGGELRSAAKPEARDSGADAASARQTAWSAAAMIAAASNSRQRATRPRARGTRARRRARVASLVGKRSARKPKDQFAPVPVHRVCPRPPLRRLRPL